MRREGEGEREGNVVGINAAGALGSWGRANAKGEEIVPRKRISCLCVGPTIRAHPDRKHSR